MKPILFNAQMVRAILDGRKTQTRRIVKFPEGMTGRLPPGGANDYLYYPGGIKRPMYHKGDILWVRETWRLKTPSVLEETKYLYRADIHPADETEQKWRPSIHMPKEAARIFLRVIDVRVERVKCLSMEDAQAEGIRGYSVGMGETGYTSAQSYEAAGNTFFDNPVGGFAALWDSTIKPAEIDRYGWDANPWVWVYTFKRCGKEGEPWNG